MPGRRGAFRSSPGKTAANNGPIEASRSTPGPRTNSPAMPLATASTMPGTSPRRDAGQVIGTANRDKPAALSDLQLGRRLQCIELDRLAPALYRRFVHFVVGQVEAGSDGGLA